MCDRSCEMSAVRTVRSVILSLAGVGGNGVQNGQVHVVIGSSVVHEKSF